MKSVTIDRLHIADHVRWAEDQEKLQPSFLQEAALVAPHSEILSSSQLYPAQFDLLFELQMCNVPWASFTPPSHPTLFFSKRFFSHRLFTTSFRTEKPPLPSVTKSGNKDLQELDNIEEKGAPVQSKDLSWHLVYDEHEGARFEEKKRSFDSASEDSSHDNKKKQTQSGEEKEEGTQDRAIQLLTEKISSLKKTNYQSSVLFERDKTALLNLLETIDWINGLLTQINGKKLQYQKG